MDGRKRSEYRPMELETNLVEHAFGSARVRLASTDVLVAVKVEIDVPSLEEPNEGKLEFFVDWWVDFEKKTLIQRTKISTEKRG